jgi:hypothetical protein
MLVNQRGGTVTGNDNAYGLDRWKASCVPDGKFTMQQSSTAPTGFINSLLVTSTSAYSVTSTDFIGLRQDIEGLNCTDLAWGTAQAKTLTLSFQVYSSLTGNFGGSLFNNAGNRSYPFSYTISSANTWTTVSVTIAGDTSGTWLTTNGRGICVFFSLGAGSSNSGTAGAWAGSFLAQPTGSTSVVGTSGATWYVTGVQLEVGTQATSFEYRQYGAELSLCYRYFQSIDYAANAVLTIGVCTSTTGAEGPISLLQTMRSAPTITLPAAGQTAGTITYLTSGGAYPSTTGTNTPNYIGVNNFAVSGASYSPNFVQGNASWLYASGSVTIKASAEL